MEKRSNWFRRKLVDPLFNLLKQGVEPSRLALAVSLGFTLAFFPVFGAHSLLCLGVIWAFRLNPGAVFLVNNLAYPLLFVLYLPQIRMGEWLFNAEPFPFSVEQVVSLVSNSPLEAIKTLWDATMRAIVAWSVIAVFTAPTVYFIMRAVFVRFIKKADNTSLQNPGL
ncbi:MAG: DUF2062 domain-containing protein [Bacteroidota bacterium]